MTRRPGRRVRDVDIPSREQILDFLREHGVPILAEDVARLLHVRGDAERDALSGRLAAMERDGQLMTNRKGQVASSPNSTS